MSQWWGSWLGQPLPTATPVASQTQPVSSTTVGASTVNPQAAADVEEITDLLTLVRRRFLPAKVACDLHRYITKRLTSCLPGLSSEEKKTLLRIKKGLAWKAKAETEGLTFQTEFAQALWAAKHPEEANACGHQYGSPEEVILKNLADIKRQVEKEEVPLPNKSLLQSWMSTHFKKAPHIKAFLTPSRWALIQKIFSEVEEEPGPFPNNIFELRAVIKHLEAVTQTDKILEWQMRVRNHQRKKEKCFAFGVLLDSKNTYTAVYEKLPQEDRKSLHPSLQSGNLYEEALELMGILRGRYRNYYSSGVRAMCARLDKVSFVQYTVTENDLISDLPTGIFICMAVAEFSVRKEFTLESQQQGGLSPFLQWYMEDILKKSSTTRWDLIAQVYPTKWILEMCSPNVAQKLYNDWLLAVDVMMPFILEQWAAGVEGRVPVDMAVPSMASNGKVDSEGWNMVVGAWNNAVRQLRLCANRLGMEPPEVFKSMKLTAHDQMMWAKSDGVGVHKDMEVFKTLVQQGIVPWSGLTRGGIQAAVAEACEQHDAKLEAWFGKPQERKQREEKSHRDMICGISLPVDKATADALKTAGLFKAKPPHQSKVHVDGEEQLGGVGPETVDSGPSPTVHSGIDTVILEENQDKHDSTILPKPVCLKKAVASSPAINEADCSTSYSHETVLVGHGSDSELTITSHESQEVEAGGGMDIVPAKRESVSLTSQSKRPKSGAAGD